MSIYVCKVCGWTYDEEDGYEEEGIYPNTSFMELDYDFSCPRCGVDKSHFEKKTT